MDYKYSDYISDAKALLGQENIQVVENTFLSIWCDQAIEEVYEMEPWEDILLRDQRTLGSGAILSTSEVPADPPTPLLPAIQKLWLTTEGDPYSMTSMSGIRGFKVSGGVYLHGRAEDDVLWALYAPKRVPFRGEEYDASKVYHAGDIVYYDTTVNYYVCIATTTAGDLPTDDTKFKIMTISGQIYPFVRDMTIYNYLASRENQRYQFYETRADRMLGDAKMNLLRGPYSRVVQMIRESIERIS